MNISTVWSAMRVILLAGLAAGFYNVNAQPNQTKKYDLSAGPCSAKGYPMTIKFGAFRSSANQGFPVPSGHHLNGKFGLSSRAWAVGDPMQFAPNRLQLLYFSFLEDKFYEGEFALPVDQIKSALNQGFWDPEKKKQITFNKFTVCVLPKGAVVVWLTGPGKQVVIGRFQAKESSTDAADFKQYFPASDRAEMLKEQLAEVPAAVRAEVTAGKLSAARWDQYLVMYPWNIEASQTLQMSDYFVSFLSGAYTANPVSSDLTNYIEYLTTPVAKAVPEKMDLNMADLNGKKFGVKVDLFDEAQTQSAFQTLQKLLPGAPITLWIQMDNSLKNASLILQNASRKIPLDKSAVRIVSYQ